MWWTYQTSGATCLIQSPGELCKVVVAPFFDSSSRPVSSSTVLGPPIYMNPETCCKCGSLDIITGPDNASINQRNETRFLLELLSWMQALLGLSKDANCIFPLNCSEARLQREARYAKPPYPHLPRPPRASDNVDGNRNKRGKKNLPSHPNLVVPYNVTAPPRWARKVTPPPFVVTQSCVDLSCLSPALTGRALCTEHI
ncbi:hypothetical protein Naga_100152g2 [Nannochloropsis gaditana]|uniref:Uncharacterized protein n=1 Tax=Nannochloropsis gaditana TaxID=72520 RepID=W7TT13_9STRA|nr:hypothetical protein Naga_100152g2 [Nannochloropsis gaditana]